MSSAEGIVVTAAGPAMRGVPHELALPTFRRWAQRWGFGGAADRPPQRRRRS